MGNKSVGVHCFLPYYKGEKRVRVHCFLPYYKGKKSVGVHSYCKREKKCKGTLFSPLL